MGAHAVKVCAASVAAIALLVVLLVTLRGYDPGDAGGATRMYSTRSTGLISLGLAVAALLPLGVLRLVALAGAALFLLLALGFWVGLLGGH